MGLAERFCGIGVVLSVALTAAAQQAPAAGHAKAIAASRQAMHRLVEPGSVPGASIAVSVGNEVVWTEGFGYADLERQAPATAATQFGIGSISKALTTALFAHMAEKGVVDWDAPVQRYLPEFPHKAITPRMIAGHTSGMGDEFNNANRLTTRAYSTREALTEILKEPLRSAPGAEYFYATGTYTILASILERTAGRSFRELMQAELLEPLGLGDTIPNDGGRSPNPNRTAFYVPTDAGKAERIPDYNPSFKLAGAGYLSTAADVARFGAAMLPSSASLSSKVRAEVLRPVALNNGTHPVSGVSEGVGAKDRGLGLGWSLATDAKGRRLVLQPGGGPGITAWLVVYPDERLVIAILSNRTAAPIGEKAFTTISESFLGSDGK